MCHVAVLVVCCLHAAVRRRQQVVNEFDSCLTTIRAVGMLHTHGKTSFRWTKEDGEPWTENDGKTPKFYKLTSVSTARLAFFLFVQVCRLTIACALCYGGSAFIAHTIQLGDLVLNCVALEVCLSSPLHSPARPKCAERGSAKLFFCASSVCYGGRRAAVRRLRPQKAEEVASAREKARAMIEKLHIARFAGCESSEFVRVSKRPSYFQLTRNIWRNGDA